MASDDDGGASDGTITEYGQFREATAHKPLTPPAPQPQTWWLVPFILLTAAGGHASAHALMPAAPAMEKAGMSAIEYSLLTLVPIAGEVVMPVLWGRFYGRRPRSALCIAPLALLAGQLAAAAALALRERAGGDFDARSIALVISGLSLYLLSKGGLTVMQHAVMALALHAAADLEPPRSPAHLDRRLHTRCAAHASHARLRRPRSLVAGLCLQVATTHFIAAAANFSVPRILSAHGFLGVALALLVPGG